MASNSNSSDILNKLYIEGKILKLRASSFIAFSRFTAQTLPMSGPVRITSCLVRKHVRSSEKTYKLLHYASLLYTTLHYTEVHYTTLHYTALPTLTTHHTTILHYTTLHYTTLHYTSPQYSTLHYTTL